MHARKCFPSYRAKSNWGNHYRIGIYNSPLPLQFKFRHIKLRLLRNDPKLFLLLKVYLVHSLEKYYFQLWKFVILNTEQCISKSLKSCHFSVTSWWHVIKHVSKHVLIEAELKYANNLKQKQDIFDCAHAVMPWEIQQFAESMQVVMLAWF